MANPWFRMYSEFAHDAKVQMMSEAMQRRYIMLLCMRCSNDLVTLHETEIAFHMRISETELAETKQLFVSKGFIDEDWNLLNWEKRQFASDSSAARVARHREKKKTARNVDVTLQKRKSNALDTDTDTDTDTDKTLGASTSDTPSDADSENHTQTPTPEKQKNKPAYPEWFETLWAVYPPRLGGNDKRRALHAATARVKSGVTHQELLDAVFRYAKFLQANGNWNTQFVMQAATFFGPGEHIKNPWRFGNATGQPGSFRPSHNKGLDPNDTTWIEPLVKPGANPMGGTANQSNISTVEGNFSRVDGGNIGPSSGSGDAPPMVARVGGGGH